MGRKGSKKAAAKQPGSKAWAPMAMAATFVGTFVAQKALDTLWRAASGKKPPTDPANPAAVRTGEALLWSALSGVVVAEAKMLATRKAAQYYAESTGHLPPPMAKAAAKAAKAGKAEATPAGADAPA
ncbi:DUF4235 domain-containing protein [Nocardioides limicola]|uniref:DUF4235 domain-containing protein n=1 Tax=Nocardioides limicola TaxID=2803368 RepID=UPI00193BF740|nr:DUF4235 domain-containing protein [Nocardioides sp. DJM-14]